MVDFEQRKKTNGFVEQDTIQNICIYLPSLISTLQRTNSFIRILGMLDIKNMIIMAARTVDIVLDTAVVEVDKPFRRFFIFRMCKITIDINATKNGMAIIDISTKALNCHYITFSCKRYRRILYNAAIKREVSHAPKDMRRTIEYWKVRL